MKEDERLQPSEADEVRRRLKAGDKESSGAVTVAELAEASGVSVSEVAAQVERLRAERAFADKPARKPVSKLSIGAAVVLVPLAAFVCWETYKAANPAPTPAPPRKQMYIPGMAAPTSPGFNQQFGSVPVQMHSGPPVASVRMNYMVQWGEGAPPRGLQVDVTGQSTSHLGDGMSTPKDNPNAGYTERLNKLVRCLVVLGLGQEDFDRDSGLAKPGTVYHDMGGNVFEVVKGKLHFAIYGQCTAQSWMMPNLHNPPTAAEMATIKNYATKALSVDSTDDSLPPPGFSVTVACRTSQDLNSRSTRPGSMKAEQVALRLSKVIEAALDRDKSAQSSAPMPVASRISIHGPTGDVNFDLPTTNDAQTKSVLTMNTLKAAAQVGQ